MKERKITRIIRHAESEANAGGFFDNPATIKITIKGQEQAESLIGNLDKSEIILVSKFERTHQTALPFIDANPEIPVASSLFAHEFHYLNPQKFIGKSGEEKKQISKNYWITANPFYRDADDTETFDEFVRRVHNLILSLKNFEHRDINLFSHGLVIKAIKLLTTEFSDLFKKDNDEYKKEIKRFMQRFYQIMHDKNFETPNVSINDLSENINNYIY